MSRAARLLALALCACNGSGAPPAPPSTSRAEPPAPSAPTPQAPPAAAPSASISPPSSSSPAPPGSPSARGEARYAPLTRHSPLTKGVVAGLRGVLARGKGRRGVFAKVGDSITISRDFLRCFDGADVQWGAHASLAETRGFFAETRLDDGSTSFSRATIAAKVGWMSSEPLRGSPSPLERELDALSPAFAVVMLGTNDAWEGAPPFFDRNMRRVVDVLVARGVVPVLTTTPPRRVPSDQQGTVAEVNGALWAIAQERQVPLIDLHGALASSEGQGLSPDGVHPRAFESGREAHTCWLGDDALAAGMNARNLLTLEALDRLRRFVLLDAQPEAPTPPLRGEGTQASPFEIDALPFVDARDLSRHASRVASWGCGKQATAGPEVVYRLRLERPATVRARVLGDDGVDADLLLLSGDASGPCVKRADARLDAALSKGVHHLVVDAREGKAGRVRLTVLER